MSFIVEEQVALLTSQRAVFEHFLTEMILLEGLKLGAFVKVLTFSKLEVLLTNLGDDDEDEDKEENNLFGVVSITLLIGVLVGVCFGSFLASELLVDFI